MDEKELKTIAKMSEMGGAFVKALALCFYKADRINFNKLKETFKDYWEEYEKK